MENVTFDDEDQTAAVAKKKHVTGVQAIGHKSHKS